jgi:hypothetical protein
MQGSDKHLNETYKCMELNVKKMALLLAIKQISVLHSTTEVTIDTA